MAAAGAGAAALAGAAVLAAAGGAFVFARSPGEYIANRELNMGDTDDKKMYFKAIEKLTSSDKLFDLQPGNLKGFLDTLKDRANVYGWNDPILGILQIPVDPNDPNPITDNLLEEYGIITLERVRAFEVSYINMHNRPSQDSAMLYHCLMASITQEAKNTIQMWRKDFMVGDLPSGNLLLRVIIRESTAMPLRQFFASSSTN
jgi:hypothetical protein